MSLSQRPPWTETPHTVKSGRYAFYWIAFLFVDFCVISFTKLIFVAFCVQNVRKFSTKTSVTLISGHQDVTSEGKMKLVNISQISVDDFVKLPDVMGFSKVVQSDLGKVDK